MRIFYDTNVVLSALLWKGEVYRAHADLVERGFVPVTSESVVREVRGVLERKFSHLDAEDLERTIRERWEVVSSAESESSRSLRDPDDEFVLADAEAAAVAVLLTGDRDLLDVADLIRTLRVMTVQAFRTWAP